MPSPLSLREYRRAAGASFVAVALVLVAGTGQGEWWGRPSLWRASAASAQELPAPSCTPGVLTPAQTAGPFYKSGAPERTSLIESGMTGTRLLLTGYVLTADCQPIPGAWLDFWQADAAGQYDNRGYTLRGQQYADEAGRYTLETVVPAEYPGRTSHIHVKVQAPDGPVLTSQLYFPNAGRNATDGIFNRALVMTVQETPEGQQATFDFVVARSE